ncbi:MAG: hypothetical protein NTX25_03480 [Proteobacteria bacterium]|nr:hypothetical protein [Pseudomonadota bacterium]
MDHRREIDDWQAYLDQKLLERKKRRKIWLTLVFVIIILLLLLLIRCEDPIVPDVAQGKKIQKGSGLEGGPIRDSVSRLSFDHSQGGKLVWTAEIYHELQRRKAEIKSCFPVEQSYSFGWNFSYQTKTGTFLHQDFTWASRPADETVQLCLRRVLERSYKLKVMPKEELRWFQLEIRYSDDVGHEF